MNYKCEMCHDTGYYGDMGPGIKGNREYIPCECRQTPKLTALSAWKAFLTDQGIRFKEVKLPYLVQLTNNDIGKTFLIDFNPDGSLYKGEEG